LLLHSFSRRIASARTPAERKRFYDIENCIETTRDHYHTTSLGNGAAIRAVRVCPGDFARVSEFVDGAGFME
jgi:hypothetical protein